MISINTKRLHLRNLAQNDADVMFDYRNNEICARYQRGQTKDFEGIVSLIERRKNDEISMTSPCMISVALKETNEMIGEIVVMPKDNTFSIGYTFSYKYHRQGYAFEALTVLIEYLQIYRTVFRIHRPGEGCLASSPWIVPSVRRRLSGQRGDRIR